MIRWYDYVLAVIAAYFILGFILAGIYASVWWESIIYGAIAGVILQFWNSDYCAYRLRQEKKNERF